MYRHTALQYSSDFILYIYTIIINNLFIRAIEDILLLKEFQHSNLMREHFIDKVLSALYK